MAFKVLVLYELKRPTQPFYTFVEVYYYFKPAYKSLPILQSKDYICYREKLNPLTFPLQSVIPPLFR